jgi:hypothetical protein
LEKGLMTILPSLYIFIIEKELRNYTKESKYGCTYWGWIYFSLGLYYICLLLENIHEYMLSQINKMVEKIAINKTG